MEKQHAPSTSKKSFIAQIEQLHGTLEHLYSILCLIYKLLAIIAKKSNTWSLDDVISAESGDTSHTVSVSVSESNPDPYPCVDQEGRPIHVDLQWTLDYLDIHRSNFYRNVHKKLLHPVISIGRRHYYLKSEVLACMQRRDKGDHTFSKLRQKK